MSLKGNESTSRGLGARVMIVSAGNNLIREVDGGSSHISQNTSILHFGLGDLNKIDTLIVTWPGGKKQIRTEIPINDHINIDEIENIWKSHQDNKFDESFKIFNLMCLSQWLENNSLSGNL